MVWVQSALRIGALSLATSVTLLAASVPADAALKPISGKLSKPGYTLIALAANGKATSVPIKRHSFRLRPTARRVTLHLRAKNGTYAGPILIGRKKKGRRTILGIKAGARLGRIKVRRGYARVVGRLPTKWVDKKRWARARRGVPIGAGNFGFVRAKPRRAAVQGDLDLDGIPDPLDVDDNGNLILDNFELGRRAATAETASSGDPCAAPCAPDVGLASILTLRIDQTVNANAAALTVEDIDAALSEFGFLHVGYPHDATTELDCRGLSYCSAGGTGRVGFTGPTATVSSGAPFPACCDPDGDGFGTLNLAPFDPGSEGHPGQFFLAHRATTSEIGTGDVLIERATSGGAESQFPIALQDVFATVPALVSYDDGGGAETVSYPVAPSTPGCPPPGCGPGGPGTFGNGLRVAARPNGDVVLTLTFWRPQRKSIPGETSEWTDIGGLAYTAPRLINPELPGPQQFPGAGPCPQGAFSTTDRNLAPSASSQEGGLKDTATDQPASPANVITYTLNVTRCLATTGLSWEPGHELQLFFDAGNGSDRVEQTVIFRRQ
jgi:hypothetical protein